MLQRMRTLAVQASSETNTTADQAALQIEFAALRTEIDRVANDTQWNGEDILDGTGGTALVFTVPDRCERQSNIIGNDGEF